MRAVLLAAAAAAAAAPFALADVAGDKWEGTWHVSGAIRGTLVLKPAADAATRSQAPACAGGRVYRGAYSGSRAGTVAACARAYALSGRRYERGKAAGGLSASWELSLAPDGTIGAPTFRGALTGAGAARWSGTWLRKGGTLLASPSAASGGATSGSAAAIAKVEAILRRNRAKCELTWTTIDARRVGTRWVVTVSVRTFGNPGKATWNVVGSRVAAAEPLAADISIGCP